MTGCESANVKRKDIHHGELVLLSCSGWQSLDRYAYYQEKDGSISFISAGCDVYGDDGTTLVSILQSINDEALIFRYKGRPDWVYSLVTKDMISKTYTEEALELYNSDQIKEPGSYISKTETEIYLKIYRRAFERANLPRTK